MAMDSDTGRIRGLADDEKPKAREVLFRQGELIEVKGCMFLIHNIFPNPENKLILKGQPKVEEEKKA